MANKGNFLIFYNNDLLKWTCTVNTVSLFAGTLLAPKTIGEYKAIFFEWSLYNNGPYVPVFILSPANGINYNSILNYRDSNVDRRITMQYSFSGRYADGLISRSQYDYNQQPTDVDATRYIYIRKFWVAE